MFILVNLKAYDCDPGTVARAVTQLDIPQSVRLGIAPQPSAIPTVAETGVETWSQHVDPIDAGSHTGHIRPAAVAAAGAAGTLLNHSERRLTLDAIDTAIAAAEAAGLQTVVCANSPEQVGAVAALGPDAIAIEPPELIGTGTPVSQANPDLIQDAVDAAVAVNPDIAVYCGAGISTGADVAAAQELGADGVLLASGVAKASDPQAALADLISGFA